MSETAAILAKNMARLLDERGGLVKVAERSGVSKATIAAARDQTHALQLTKLEKIAHAHGLDAWQLIAPALGRELTQAAKVDAGKLANAIESVAAARPDASIKELAELAAFFYALPQQAEPATIRTALAVAQLLQGQRSE